VYCEARANEDLSSELTTAEIKRVLDDLGDLKVRRFFVIGGEPLVRRDLFDVLRHAKQRRMTVGIFTNSLLTRKYQREFRDIELDNVWTSVDGLNDTHNRYRGSPNSYQITLDAIRYYSEIEIPTIVVNTVVHPANFGEVEDLFQELKDAGMNWWRLGVVMPVGRASDNSFSLSPSQTVELFDYVRRLRRSFKVTITEEMGYLACWEDLRDTPFFCHAGLTFCAIMPDGHVVPCQTDNGSLFSQGNVREKPFAEIWRDGFKAFRKVELEEHCTDCEYRSACSGGCWIGRVSEAACVKCLLDGNGGACAR
jgi:radical SAM protein with 4Fe4S-binding SPASM domain